MSEDTTVDPISNIVICCDKVTLPFRKRGSFETQNVKLALNLFPVVFVDDQLYGYLRNGQDLNPIKFGIVIHLDSSKRFWHLGKDFKFSKSTKPSDGVTYIAGWGSDFQKSDSPEYNSLVVKDGKSESLPAVFVFARADKLILWVIYYDNSGNLFAKECGEGDSEVQEILRNLLTSRGFKFGLPQGRFAFLTHQAADFTSTKSTEEATQVEPEIDWSDPKSIVRYLDRFVIGQRRAKIMVATAFSAYMTKVKANDPGLPRDNIFLLGSSGVGKTYMVSLLAKKAGLLFAEAKLSGKSSEGYKGRNLSQIFDDIRSKTTEEAPFGVVFLDEIDKLAMADSDDFFGPRLQDEMIGWFEEETILDPENERNAKNGKERPPLNTKNLLFVVAGAFQHNRSSSLARIIKRRLASGVEAIGFKMAAEIKTKVECSLVDVTPEDLIEYGLKPELIGRLPVIVPLDDLTIENKIEILKRAENSCLTKYKKLLSVKGFKLDVSDEALEVIATECPKETGARALNSICSRIIYKILFNPNEYSKRVGSENRIELTGALAESLLGRALTAVPSVPGKSVAIA